MPKILIIEDEKMLREMYEDKFKKAGLEVISVKDAEGGLAAAKKEKPDIILLDILLPKKDGLFVLEQIKEGVETAGIKVVAFSNFDDPGARQAAEQIGVTAYLIKTDFTPAEIVKKVQGYLK